MTTRMPDCVNAVGETNNLDAGGFSEGKISPDIFSQHEPHRMPRIHSVPPAVFDTSSAAMTAESHGLRRPTLVAMLITVCILFPTFPRFKLLSG